MQHGFKPYAPFGDILNKIKESNIKIRYSVIVFCGKNAWIEARINLEEGQCALFLPKGTDPNSYIWPVSDLNIIVYDTGGCSQEAISKLVDCLVKSGAKICWVYSDFCPDGVYFTKE